jgi:dTMP kinase
VTGRFIAFEGGEATGKSTQAARLAQRLGAVLTREPGGTAAGERIRSLVLDPDLPVGPRAEALLMAAARAQHVDLVIRPALVTGTHVVSDRFTGSSLAYQGIARALGVDAVAALSAFATDGLSPDVVILLDLPTDVAAARLTGERDRMEREDVGFHAAVAEGFRTLAAADPAHWTIVDAAGTPDEVEAAVWAAVEPRLADAR